MLTACRAVRPIAVRVPEMSFDQTVQILGLAGSWIAGLGSLAAALIALSLARRVNKVRLRSWVGIRTTFGGGAPQQELVNISTTNVGERPVTISSIGWCIGKGKRRRHSVQMFSGVLGDSVPKKIEHGETASFMISLSESPDWYEYFAKFLVHEGYTVPIRLSPIPTTSRVLPIPRVKLGLGRAAISPAMSSAS